MIRRLQPWVWSGAWALAMVAGMINVAGILGFEGQPVTHLTGTTSMLASSLVALNWQAALTFAGVLASFFAGCAVSGFLIKDGVLKLGRRYGIALLLESLCLWTAVPLLLHHERVGVYALAGACGLQNAMASTYSGFVIRTTHLSGMFTDLGIFAGHYLRGIPVDKRRAGLYSVIVSGFFLGGVAGALGYARWEDRVLMIPACATAIAALAYWMYVAVARRRRLASGA